MRWLAALLLLAAPAQAQPRWPDYQVIFWQGQTEAGYRALREYGVTAGKVMGIRDTITEQAVQTSIAAPLAAGMPWYVENIATDLYSAYHRWTPEHPREVTWLFDETKRRYRANPDDPTAYQRTPSLSDPAWHARIRARLAETVRLHSPHRPLFYNLGDETGIADLAAPWDFDFSPVALKAFRGWLRTQYETLDALNAQWGSAFPHWDAVMPQKTTDAMAQRDDNFSAWADFKAWMDIAFSDSLRIGTDAIHAADPAALAGIEGAQVPGWGGYDYTRLPHAVDLIELYEGGNNLEIARSINPALVTLSTSFGSGAAEVHRIWREALMGNRGSVVYDEDGDYAQGSARAQALTPVFRELTQSLGAQLIASTPHRDPVAILYSPASQRIRWMLDHRAAGVAWTERTSETEGQADHPQRASRRRAAHAFTHLGLQPHYVSPDMLADGSLQARSIRLLVLPDAIALSDAHLAGLRGFIAGGGVVVADRPPGQFDVHGRIRNLPPLRLALPFPTAWQSDGDPEAVAAAAALASHAGVVPLIALHHPDGRRVTDVDIRLFRRDGALLIALHRDFVPTNDVTEVELNLAESGTLQDMRQGGAGVGTRLRLEPIAPRILRVQAGRQ